MAKKTVEGRVVDSDAALPNPGVMITIKSEDLMGTRETQTSTEGRFLFPKPPPGGYRRTATRHSLKTTRQVGLQRNAGRSTRRQHRAGAP